MIMLKDEYFSVSQAGKYMGVTRQTVYRWVKNGLPSQKIGHGVLITKDDIHAIVCPTCGTIKLEYARGIK